MRCRERGVVLFTTFLLLLVLAGLASAVGVLAHNSTIGGRTQLHDRQSFYLAEAAWQRGRQAMAAGTWTAAASPGNTYTESFGPGEYDVTLVDNGDGTRTITADGYLPSKSATVAKRRIVEASLPANNTSTNQSLTATASASSSQGGNTPNKANDGNTGTNWRADTTGSGEWLAMDYGSGLITLNKIVVLEHDNIDGLTVEMSSDGSTWTAVPELSVVESPAATWTATFASVREQYFRARFTSVPSGQRARVDEMQSFAPAYGYGSLRTSW